MGRAALGQVNLVSADTERSLSFYRLLGVDWDERRIARLDGHAFHSAAPGAGSGEAPLFEIDSVPFASLWNRAWSGRTDLAGKLLLGFWVKARSDVDRCWEDVTGAGHRGLHPPCDAFWGSRFAIVEDPDGVVVGIMSAQSDAHRSPPPLEALRATMTRPDPD